MTTSEGGAADRLRARLPDALLIDRQGKRDPGRQQRGADPGAGRPAGAVKMLHDLRGRRRLRGAPSLALEAPACAAS